MTLNQTIENWTVPNFELSSQIYSASFSALRRSDSTFLGDGANGLKSTKIFSNIFILMNKRSSLSIQLKRRLRRFKLDSTMCFNRKSLNGSINALESHQRNFRLKSSSKNQSSKRNRRLRSRLFWFEMSIQRQCRFVLMEARWHLRACSHGWRNTGIDAWVLVRRRIYCSCSCCSICCFGLNKLIFWRFSWRRFSWSHWILIDYKKKILSKYMYLQLQPISMI